MSATTKVGTEVTPTHENMIELVTPSGVQFMTFMGRVWWLTDPSPLPPRTNQDVATEGWKDVLVGWWGGRGDGSCLFHPMEGWEIPKLIEWLVDAGGDATGAPEPRVFTVRHVTICNCADGRDCPCEPIGWAVTMRDATPSEDLLAHAEYPHTPGYLDSCHACNSKCYCYTGDTGDAECVYCQG